MTEAADVKIVSYEIDPADDGLVFIWVERTYRSDHESDYEDERKLESFADKGRLLARLGQLLG